MLHCCHITHSKRKDLSHFFFFFSLTEEDSKEGFVGDEFVQHLISDISDLLMIDVVEQPAQHLLLLHQVTWGEKHLLEFFLSVNVFWIYKTA